MRNLFLGGGGSAAESRALDGQFVAHLAPPGRFAYIPVAMETDRYEAGQAWITSTFRPLGVTAIAVWTLLEGKAMVDLDAAGGVYLGGGDTARLLAEVHRGGFAEALCAFAEKGGAVYGGSAGAILLGRSVRAWPAINDRDMLDREGLDLLYGYSVVCHYDANDRKAIAEVAKRCVAPILALPEQGGLHLGRSRAVQSFGSEPLLIFRGDEVIEIAPGGEADLSIP